MNIPKRSSQRKEALNEVLQALINEERMRQHNMPSMPQLHRKVPWERQADIRAFYRDEEKERAQFAEIQNRLSRQLNGL